MPGPWEKYRSTQTGAGQVFSLPQDPQQVRDNARQDRNDAFNQQNRARLTNLAEQAAADARALKNLQMQKEQAALREKRATDQAAYDQMMGLNRTLGDLRNRYNKDFKGQPANRLFGLTEMLPAKMRPANGVFDDTANSLLADLAKAKGLTSQQFNTPAEQKMFFSPMIPNSSDTDEQIANKLDQLQRLVNQGATTYMRKLGMTPKLPQKQAKPAQNKTIDFNDLP